MEGVGESLDGFDRGGALAFGGAALGDLIRGDDVLEAGVGEKALERAGDGGVEHLGGGGSLEFELGVLVVAGEFPGDFGLAGLAEGDGFDFFGIDETGVEPALGVVAHGREHFAHGVES